MVASYLGCSRNVLALKVANLFPSRPTGENRRALPLACIDATNSRLEAHIMMNACKAIGCFIPNPADPKARKLTHIHDDYLVRLETVLDNGLEVIKRHSRFAIEDEVCGALSRSSHSLSHLLLKVRMAA